MTTTLGGLAKIDADRERLRKTLETIIKLPNFEKHYGTQYVRWLEQLIQETQ